MKALFTLIQEHEVACRTALLSHIWYEYWSVIAGMSGQVCAFCDFYPTKKFPTKDV